MSIRPIILYAFHASGCVVCEQEMPRVTAWATGRVAQFAFVPVNVSFNQWRPRGLEKVGRVTPTFALVRGEDVLGMHEGAFEEEKRFEKFAKSALEGV